MLRIFHKVYTICCLLLFNIYMKAYAEIFTAVTELETLLIAEEMTITELESYVGIQQKKLSLLKSYMDLYVRENKTATEDTVSYLSNSLNVFILIKRLASDLDDIPDIIKIGAESIPYLLLNHVNIMYPEQEDLTGAAQGISKLVKIYHLNVNELSNGNMNNTVFTPMTASDCYELGQALVSDKDSDVGRDWMIAAHRKYIEENVSYPFTEADIVKHLITSGDMESTSLSTQQIININDKALDKRITISTSEDSTQELKVYSSEVTGDIIELLNEVRDIEERQKLMETEFDDLYVKKGRKATSAKDEEELKNYEALCRGDLVVPACISNRLTCHYLKESHPFLKLAPFKVEMVYLDPDVILFHDVLNDIEIETIKEMAKPQLTRAQINDPKTGNLAYASYRISKVAWIFDKDSKIIAQVTKRVALMTGLSMELTIQHQVVNYGIGGHYEPHFDFTKKTEKLSYLSMNRIATILFYMSDVALGGATVFPELGARMVPVKGAAAFWFNLHPSLEGNYAMRHAACPVLQGDKWVVSKFINREPQIFIKPCSLEYQEEGFFKKIPKPVPKI